MPVVEFVGQSVQDSGNVSANPARLINCYREVVPGQGKTQYVLQSVLGMTLLDDIGAAAARATGSGNGKNWVVGDGKLFEVAQAGTLTERGAVADDVNTTISGNYGNVTIVSGNNYYVWNGSTITQPTTKTFTNVISHCYAGGYTVLLQKDGKQFQWSDLGDATTLDALNFASADKSDDNLLRGFEVQGSLVLMCERSTEFWQITGLPDTEAFSFVTSTNRGLRAHNLVTQFDDTLFWVANDDNVYIGVGPGAVDITTPAINTALTVNDPTHCFFYEDRGHKFCVIRFSDRPAWVFDVKMREWHERAEGAGDGPWRAVASVEGDSWQVFNTVGEVYSLSRVNKDLNSLLRRIAISSPLYLAARRFRVPMFEVLARVGEEILDDALDFALDAGDGFALDAGDGFVLSMGGQPAGERAAEITLSTSRDGGRTWGKPKPRSMGLNGDTEQRMVWRGLGQYRQLVIMLLITEPKDFQINSTAVLEVA